jgi:hypothetical protein
VNSPKAMRSGPRLRIADSSAGEATPDPGAEGIGSSEYPLGCILAGAVRDLVDDWDVSEGVETCPEFPSRAARSASISDRQTVSDCVSEQRRGLTISLSRQGLNA